MFVHCASFIKVFILFSFNRKQKYPVIFTEQFTRPQKETGKRFPPPKPTYPIQVMGGAVLQGTYTDNRDDAWMMPERGRP
jgi:hypothetical protein